MPDNKLSLYIHIPFCVRKCNYCDFLSFPIVSGKEAVMDDYLAALLKEIEVLGHGRIKFGADNDAGDGNRADEAEVDINHRVKTVFIGGGTPNTLASDKISEILCKLRNIFEIDDSAEISMELNPGVYERAAAGRELKKLKAAGINRLSIGLQSAEDEELKSLGRIHSFDDFEFIFQQARDAGFDNINIDLISSIPRQSLKSFSRTLKRAAAFGSEHISVYSLIIEEGTSFGDMPREKLSLPDEDEDYRIYKKTRDFLGSLGYKRYEISNYAKPGFECAHNLVYWNRGEYLGLGLGAASFIGGMRFSNTTDLEDYLKAPQEAHINVHLLSKKEAMEEFMFVGLRKSAGVSLKKFRTEFGCDFDSVYGEVAKRYASLRLLERAGDEMHLTERGMDAANEVMFAFLLD